MWITLPFFNKHIDVWHYEEMYVKFLVTSWTLQDMTPADLHPNIFTDFFFSHQNSEKEEIVFPASTANF